MPISAHPDATTEFSLKVDCDLPADVRPVFICRFMTRAEHRRVHDLMQRAYDAKDDAESYRLATEAIAIGVVGWRNLKDRDGNDVPFDLNRLEEVISDSEHWELGWSYPLIVRVAEADKKKLLSAPQSVVDSSAPTAGAGDAPKSAAS